MKKKILSVVIAGALTLTSVMPVFATPNEEVIQSQQKYEELTEKINDIQGEIYKLNEQIAPLAEQVNKNNEQMEAIKEEIAKFGGKGMKRKTWCYLLSSVKTNI